MVGYLLVRVQIITFRLGTEPQRQSHGNSDSKPVIKETPVFRMKILNDYDYGGHGYQLKISESHY
jgi:hypothetical protein